jgi:hypothetical protein
MISFAAAAQAEPSGKWRVAFSSRAGNDGTFTLRVAPEGGAPVDVETKIAASSSADKVAKAVRDSLRASLGEGYHVETDDGEDVVIGREGKTPKFEVTLACSTLTGLVVWIKKE